MMRNAAPGGGAQGPAAQLIGGAANWNPSSPSSASWFSGAPITRLCAVATVVFYVLFHAKSAQDAMAMDLVLAGRQWHRFWSSKITFGSTGELVMGGTLLAVLARQYEREMGSRKFGIFLLITNACVIVQEMIFMGFSTTVLMATRYRYQGPYALLGALMYLFHSFSPRLHPRFFGILGFTFSEKAFYYLWFAQVVGYGGSSSTLVTTLGALTAYAYISWNLHAAIDLPDVIAKPLTVVGAHLSEPPPRIVAPTNTNNQRGRGGGGGAAGDAIRRILRNNNNNINPMAQQAAPAPRPVAPPAPPDPAAIEQLTSMGFERQEVINALQATNNNVERAADRLLMG